MISKELAQQALDALESASPLGATSSSDDVADAANKKHCDALKALRAAIAQGESEPIGESVEHKFDLTELVLQDICELDPDDPTMNDTVCIDISVLARILKSRFSETITESKNLENALNDLQDESRCQSEVVKQMISERNTMTDMLTKWRAGKICAQDVMVMLYRVYSNNQSTESTNTVVDELVSSTHGYFNKINLERSPAATESCGHLAEDGYFLESREYVAKFGMVPRHCPLYTDPHYIGKTK